MKMICGKCGGSSFIKKGYRNGIQRYLCTSVNDGVKCSSYAIPIFMPDEEDSPQTADEFDPPIEDTEGSSDRGYEDIISQNVLLAKKAQRYQDINRIERKSFREHSRIDNALISLIQELKDIVSKNSIQSHNFDSSLISCSSKSVGIIHLSDLHFNELVDIIGNRYDFKVASQRLKLFASKAIIGLLSRNIDTVYIALTGDLLNSDRRLDEVLSMASNRATATFIAVKLLSQFILHIAKYFNVNVISVTGNESRIREDYTQIDTLATDNFDFIIYEMLKLYMELQAPRITFVSGNTFEYVLSINNTNILITHGHRLGKMEHTDISKVAFKWAKKGVIINAVVCGHLHETKITDTLLRSGSLVGNNAYADVGLNLHSMASQNFYIVDERGSIDATRVDLQNVDDGCDWYTIDEELDAYNAKSIGKLKSVETVFRVVI